MQEHAALELDWRLYAVQAQAVPRARMADCEAIGKEPVDAAWSIPIPIPIPISHAHKHKHQHVELKSPVAGFEAAPLSGRRAASAEER
jgi:SgrR family transcriptional regulator